MDLQAVCWLLRYNEVQTMNLHRNTGTPDWEMIAVEERTAVQKLAAATKGIVTPPNFISVLGFGLVMYGLGALLQEAYWVGLIALGVGRLLDVVDGAVAQLTGTKSPLGELVDATIDKFGTLFTIAVFYIAGISFWWLITALLLPQILISLIVLYKRIKNQKVHPTLSGKLSMGALWVALVGLVVMKALTLAATHPFSVGVYAVSVISVGLGLYALWQYTTNRD